MKSKILLASRILLCLSLAGSSFSTAAAQVVGRMAGPSGSAPALPGAMAPVSPESLSGLSPAAFPESPSYSPLLDLSPALGLTPAPAAAAPALNALPLSAPSAIMPAGTAASPTPYIDPRLLSLPVSMDSDGPGRQIRPAAAASEENAPARGSESPATLGSLQSLSGVLRAEDAQRPSAASDPNAAYFDGNLRARDAVDASEAGPAALPPAPADGASLARRKPRVVLMLDTFGDKAPDAAVQAIEKLLDNNVRVLFITPRPERGEDSAYSVLVDRLKARVGNPLLVVSYNGARITDHRPRRTEGSNPFIDDLPGLPEGTVEKFREITERLKPKFGIRGALEEVGRPSLENAHIYEVHFPKPPKDFKPAKYASEFNRALRSKGLPYKIDFRTDAAGRLYYFTQSTALKVNKLRIQSALYALAPELDPAHNDATSLKPGQALVLGNPTKAAGFLATLDKGTSIHGVNDAETMTVALRAILGEEALEPVVVWRSELNDYRAWLERKQKFGSSPSISGPKKGRKKGGATNQQLAFFKGIVMKALLTRLHYFMRQGQYDLASPEAAQALLTDVWRNPAKHGVYIPEELQLARQTPGWRSQQNGTLETARQYLREFYRRNLPNYPIGVSEQVVGRLVNLASDGKNSVPVTYASPFTGRRYIVWVRPDRVEVKRDDLGWIITAHVDRTGKEPYATEFDEWAEVNIVGRGALEGYASKGTPLLGQDPNAWYLNDQPNPRVRVVFHYNTRDLSKTYTPAQLDSYTPQVLALIEKRAADMEYLAWLEAQEKARERAANALRRQVREQQRNRARKPA